MDDAGSPPTYAGDDYGLYQIYGTHILCGPDTLLYIGRATEQTFASRFRQHQRWLEHEELVHVYLGRSYMPDRHVPTKNWMTWVADMQLAERILIYKYSPPYNSVSIAEPPTLGTVERITLIHEGRRHQLHNRDLAPDDWW